MKNHAFLLPLIFISLQIIIGSCEKEKDFVRENLTQREWKLVKSEIHAFINEALDTVKTSRGDISIYFLANGEVHYYHEDILAPHPMTGKWWFSDNKTFINTDLGIRVSTATGVIHHPILPRSEIIELTANSLILKEKELLINNNAANEEIKHVIYSHYSNK